jgi:hypothetical protein
MRFNDVLNAMMIVAVLLIIGFVSGLHIGKTSQKRVTDTITQVQLIERPVTIRDSVHTKSVMIRNRDTVYFLDRPVEIPCGDTAFVAQSDSVITATRDTINMAFAYANRKGYFSLVFKPRPDSIITVQLPVVKTETKTEWAWLLGLFGLGIGIGSYAGK